MSTAKEASTAKPQKSLGMKKVSPTQKTVAKSEVQKAADLFMLDWRVTDAKFWVSMAKSDVSWAKKNIALTGAFVLLYIAFAVWLGIINNSLPWFLAEIFIAAIFGALTVGEIRKLRNKKDELIASQKVLAIHQAALDEAKANAKK